MNIYKILESLQRVEESAIKQVLELFGDWMNSEDCPHNDMAGDDRAVMGCAYRYLNGKVDPSKIDDYAELLTKEYHGGLYEADYPFAGKAVGQKAGDQVRGKEKAKPTAAGGHPFKGRLVGAMESIAQECDTSMSPLEKRLRARWEETKAGLQEYGMTTGGTAMAGGTGTDPTANNTPDPAAVAKTAQNAQKNFSTLKQGGVELPVGASQAAQSATKTATDPDANPSSQDRKISGSLGNELEQLATNTDPGKFNSIVNAIKQAKQGQ